MAPSAILTSKSAFRHHRGLSDLLIVLEPPKQMRTDVNSANDVFALIQEIVIIIRTM